MTTPFLESPRFPDEVAFWAQGGPKFSTTVVQLNSGGEQRNINWATPLTYYNIQDGLRTQANIQNTISFFNNVMGMGYGFRFKDFNDFMDNSGGVLGTGVGNGLPTYQMYKKYISGSFSMQKKIQKPVASQVVNGATIVTQPYRNGSPVPVPSGATLDTTTGIFTFSPDATATISSFTIGATTSIVCPTNPGSFTAGKLMYLSGFAGINAATLNNQAFVINSISGTGPFTFVLAVNTTGLTISIGSAIASHYPQASDALTWQGTFDVPVRFGTDLLQQMGQDSTGALFTMGQVTLAGIRV